MNRSQVVRIPCLAAFLLGLPLLCRAVTTTIEADALEWPGMLAKGVRADLIWDEHDSLSVSLAAESVELGGGWRVSKVRLTCASAIVAEDRLRCERGSLRGEGTPGGPIAAAVDIDYRPGDGHFELSAHQSELAGGTAGLDAEGTYERWRARLNARALDLLAVRKLLETLDAWPQGYGGEAGTVDLDADIVGSNASLTQAHLQAQARDLSLSGTHLADHADIGADVTVSGFDGGMHVEGETRLTRGAVYIEPGFSVGDYKPGITFEVTEEPVSARFKAALRTAGGAIDLERMELSQPGVATVLFAGELMPGTASPVRTLRTEIVAADLKAINERHLKALCSHIDKLCGLEMEGSVQGAIEWEAAGMKEIDLRFGQVYLDDARRRFRLAGLNGDLSLSAGAQERHSRLSWEGAGLYRLNLGASRIAAVSRQRALTVTEWSDVPVLDGALKLDAVEIRDVGLPTVALTMQGVLAPVSLPGFCQVMGWPIMAGKLSGVIPQLTYRHGTLSLHGDLLMRMFDGNVVIRGLRIEDLFGGTPVLTTDVDIGDIDLEQLTRTFSFGKIEGKLQGAIHKLRLEDWRPTYFEARLETPPEDSSRHRISQRAVDNLSAIGSGGVGGSLSRGFLNVFKEYSYDRLGLSCRLSEGVCEMGGVAPAPDGFYIVTRGGLLPPWVDVKGTGHAVPWNDLVYGLKEIARREMKIQ